MNEQELQQRMIYLHYLRRWPILADPFKVETAIHETRTKLTVLMQERLNSDR